MDFPRFLNRLSKPVISLWRTLFPLPFLLVPLSPFYVVERRVPSFFSLPTKNLPTSVVVFWMRYFSFGCCSPPRTQSPFPVTIVVFPQGKTFFPWDPVLPLLSPSFFFLEGVSLTCDTALPHLPKLHDGLCIPLSLGLPLPPVPLSWSS